MNIDRERFWKALGAEITKKEIPRVYNGTAETWTLNGLDIGFVRVIPEQPRDCYLVDPADAGAVPLEVLIKGLQDLLHGKMKYVALAIRMEYDEDKLRWLYWLRSYEAEFDLRTAILAAIGRLITEADK
jgi:hypothetical protein